MGCGASSANRAAEVAAAARRARDAHKSFAVPRDAAAAAEQEAAGSVCPAAAAAAASQLLLTTQGGGQPVRVNGGAGARAGGAGAASGAATPAQERAGRRFVVIDEDPLAAVSKGISLRGLRQLTERIRASFTTTASTNARGGGGGGVSRFEQASCAAVVAEWVLRMTKDHACRVSEHCGIVDPSEVGVPHYFVSHPWSGSYAHLVRTVEAFLADAPDDTRVWLDLFAVNQHAGTPYQKADVAAFREVLAAAAGGCLAVTGAAADPGEDGGGGGGGGAAAVNPAARAWCLREWAASLEVHGADGLHMPLQPEERAAIVGAIDIAKAECSVATDKEAIMADIAARHGGAEAFDAALKLDLLLQPLSYRLDLRTQTQPAAGAANAAPHAVWGLAPVREWLAAGSAVGGSQVLCVTGGAGEGKSALSAALCDPERGELREAIGAFHFFRCADARRRDPVRIVKTLARQLADRFPALRQRLLQLDAREVAALHDAGRAVELLLQRPLEAMQQQQQQQGEGGDGEQQQRHQVVILLEALDEAGGPQGDAHAAPPADGLPPVGLALLCEHLRALPALLRFIVTTQQQPGAAAADGAAAGQQQVLPVLEAAFGLGGVSGGEGAAAGGPSGVTVVPISRLRAEGNDASSSSTSGGDGAPLYAAMRDAAPQAPAPQHPPALADVHALFAAAFDAAAERDNGDPERGAQVADLVAVVAAVQEPPSLQLISQLRLGEAVEHLPGAPTLFFVFENRLHMAHKALLEWLLDPAASGRHAADVVRGHELVGMHLAEAWAAGGATAARHHPYMVRYMAHHLAAAAGGRGRPASDGAGNGDGASGSGTATGSRCEAAAAALDRLLVDLAFLRAVFEIHADRALAAALGHMQRPTALSLDVCRWLTLARDAGGVGGPGGGSVTVPELVRSLAGIVPASSSLRAAASATAAWQAVPELPPAPKEWL